LQNGRLTGDTSLGDLAALLKAFGAAAPQSGMTIHFHGGLTHRKHGLHVASFLQPRYEEAGAFPVFFVWETGMLETLRDKLWEVSRDSVFQRMVQLVMTFSLEWLGGLAAPGGRGRLAAGAGPTPDDVDAQVDDWLNGRANDPSAPPFETFSAALDARQMPLPEVARIEEDIHYRVVDDSRLQAALEAIATEDNVNAISAGTRGGPAKAAIHGTQIHGTQMSPDGLAQMLPLAAAGKRGLLTAGLASAAAVSATAFIVRRVLRRFQQRRDHGLLATVEEEVLRQLFVSPAVKTLLWDQMKQNAANAFGDNRCVYGGTAFLAGLGEALRAGAAAGWPLPRITLVGHSAGSIYICEFLKAADQLLPQDVQFDVVFLAPAVTVRQFDATLLAHGHRVRDFRMFTMTDELEQKDPCLLEVGKPSRAYCVYPRSLLYCVSGLLEERVDEPLLGMQRFFLDSFPCSQEQHPEIGRVRSFLAGKPHGIVWAIGNHGGGLRSEAIAHGAFDDEPHTIDSVCWLVRHGFGKASGEPSA
jgi:hypothetical protein